MSGKKPPTSLVLRARPDLSDADLASLIVRSSYLFGRKKPTAIFDEEVAPSPMVNDRQDFDPKASYLIYCETVQAFIGLVRDGAWKLEHPRGIPRLRLVFYLAAKA